MTPRDAARPLVWVTGPERGGLVAWWFTRFGVWRAGGRAVRVTPNRSRPSAGPDALILGGGADVGAAIRHGTPVSDPTPADAPVRSSGLGRTLIRWLLAPAVLLFRGVFSASDTPRTDPDRDRLEQTLLQQALGRGNPVLGICRGMQLLNVVLGGTLHEDVQGFYAETPQLHTVLARKRVSLQAGSRIAAILGTDHAHVNALHHQAVDALGRRLRVTAVDTAGVIQAIETGQGQMVLGVQWHPEYLPQSRRQRRIFTALVEAAGQRRGG